MKSSKVIALLRRDPALPARVWMRARWRSLAALVLVMLGVIVLDAWLGTCGFTGCPTVAEIQRFRPPEGSRVLDRDGRLIGRLSYIRRINVPLARVPVPVRQAFVATEDRRFYRHHGLDWRGAVRATVRNVGALGVREGFSTITMQVARNTFTRQYGMRRSLRRKLLEMRMARLLEASLSKDRILELYLNAIYLGNGTYGVEAASRDLFGKRTSELTLAEGAMLAALPKAPSIYSPRHDLERALKRRNLVLSLMAREGYISQHLAEDAADEELDVAEEEWRPAETRSDALDLVHAMVDSLLGDDAVDEDVTVRTTLDGNAQRAAERVVRTHAEAIDGWRGRGVVQGAFVAIDPRSGAIRAIVGGRRYERGGFNRALGARRQPGSAFKPFVYAAALSQGFTPASYVDDQPVDVEMGRTVWSPANFDNEYEGRITFRRALEHSSNAAAVRVSRAVGESRVIDVAKRNGIMTPLRAIPAIALGAEEVTPIELVTAYAPFANGGLRVHPRLVLRIDAPDGTVLWKAPPAVSERVMDARDAYQLTSMLQSVVDFGTGRALRDWGIRGQVAGKTGTTNNGTDVWFVGYTPTLVAGIWFGYDEPRSLGSDATGGRLAAPAWAEFYTAGWRERGAQPWRPPSGMTMRLVDAEFGELASRWCPITKREWFKPGTEPTTYCHAHEEPMNDSVDFGDRIGELLRRIFHQ